MDDVKEVKKSKKGFPAWAYLAAGALTALTVVVGFRFITFKSGAVHHHANFALYINGTQDKFDNFTFYEEVQSCAADPSQNPKSRVHMHEMKNNLVHVHDGGVTWSQFFTNLDYTLSDKLIQTRKELFTDGNDDNKLTFILNGKEVSTIANTLINSEDTLLINYGKDDQATLQKRYDDIHKDAHEANHKPDPASCSGGHQVKILDRVKYAIGIESPGH